MFYYSFDDAVSAGKRIFSKEGQFSVCVYRSAYSSIFILFRNKPVNSCFYFYHRIKPYKWVCDPFYDPSS